jgi:hypothetical protein
MYIRSGTVPQQPLALAESYEILWRFVQLKMGSALCLRRFSADPAMAANSTAQTISTRRLRRIVEIWAPDCVGTAGLQTGCPTPPSLSLIGCPQGLQTPF